jgi:putative ABC transport system permease protein
MTPARPGLLALRLAAREMRGGLKGFGVFLACLAIGVAAIAAVGTTARGLREGLGREGRAILGGDIAVTTVQPALDRDVLAALAALGPTSSVATLRAMARREDGADQTLVELKAVDGAYPLAGSLGLSPALPMGELFRSRDGAIGAAAEQALLSRLNLRVGDRLRLGEATVEIRAVLTEEPDKLAGGIGFGPRLLVGSGGLDATGLVQPGSLVRWRLAALAPSLSERELRALADALPRRFPDAGLEARTRDNASPQLTRNIERFTQFLTLVGLTALIVGGVGVANAVRGHLDARRATIATLKAVGASGRFVVGVFLIQVVMLAGLGTVLGLALGLALPAAAAALLGDALPIPLALGVYPGELALAAAYGLLVALAFALWPLGRAHDVPVRALYREAATGARGRPRLAYVGAVGVALLGLLGLAVAVAADLRVALIYAAAAGGTFLVLRLVALGVMAAVRRLPRPRATGLRLALANLHRPGALTPTVVLSLGLGLTLLVALALVDANLRSQLTSTIPERAPSFFFLDVPSGELDAFRATIAREAPPARLETVPMLRGRIVELAGRPAEGYPAPPQFAWVLSGDRGITYAATPPENSRLVAGRWWAADHAGPPLVSVEARVAEGLGLRIGDRIAVSVLGRRIEAEIANTRTVEWESLGINFVLVFSPDAFRGAPHTHLATLTWPGGADVATETGLLRAVTEAFPNAAAIRVKEALEAVNDLLGQLGRAVRGAAGLTLVAAVLVLAGALAAGQRGRLADAAILKTLGATRARLVGAFAIEYALLGLVSAVFGVAAGTAAAAVVLTRVMDLPFAFEPAVALGAVLTALAVTVGFGLAGAWRVLRAPAAPLLRSL